MNRPEAAISGVGLVTCLGASLAQTLQAWKSGQPPPLAAERIAAYPACNAAERLGNSRSLRKFMSRQSEMACLAAREALVMAAVQERVGPEQIGIFSGSGLAAAEIDPSMELLSASVDEAGCFSARRFASEALNFINPLFAFHVLGNMPLAIISILENIKGPNYAFTPWEDQSAAALLEGVAAVSSGRLEAALVVAADNPTHFATEPWLREKKILQPDEFSAPGAAALRLEAPDRAGGRALAVLSDLDLSPAHTPASDPLSARLGRTFAAAPLILAVLSVYLSLPGSMVGSKGHKFSFTVTPCAE
ncbi:MAG: hypothetical protein LBJ14_05865 [Desulfarculales bacterium]|jgi:hypothetical protein|nr:hypothetical protein [Desulfarculales bacterium]